MPYYAIGPVAGGNLTARQIRYGGLAADVTAPTGEQTLDVTAAIGSAAPQSFVGRVFTVPGGQVHAVQPTTLSEHRATLYGLAQRAYRNVLPHWQSIAVTGNVATKATERWIYHTTALLDIIATGQYRASPGGDPLVLNAARVIESWRAFIEDSDGAAVWYGVMDANATNANLWQTFSIADGRVIYCDAVHAGQGTWRTPDGSTSIIHSGNNFPANFTTETATLRTS